MPRMNREGLTWAEWRAAALCGVSKSPWGDDVLRRAWLRGEDPSEWRKEVCDAEYVLASRR